jgi:hypothetical protein
VLKVALAAAVLLPGAAGYASAGETPHHLELSLVDWRGFASGAFFLDMVPAGEVSRRGDAPLGPKHVDAGVRESLRHVVSRERFFALKKSYGAEVIEGRFRGITLTLDGKRHSVVVNDLAADDKPVDEIARALRVWYAALRALSDPDTVQIEVQDRPFLSQRIEPRD